MLSSFSIDPSKPFQIIPSLKSNKFLLVKRLNIRNLNLVPTYESILSSEKNKVIELENIIPIIDYFVQDKNLFVISESISNVSLNDFLKQKKSLTENESCQIIQSIIFGIEELKKVNLAPIHGNLNKNNIFILKDIDDHVCCKLTDYHQIIKITANFQNSYSIAPEILEKKTCFLAQNQNIDFEKNYSKADVWSIGWLLYELLFGKELWDYTDLKKVVEFMTNEENSSLFINSIGISDTMIDFLKKSLNYDPNNRMSWLELINHPLFLTLKSSEKKVDIIKIDLSKFELSLKKEEVYAKYKFDIKGTDGQFPNEIIINGYSNEFNLINKNYDFEIVDSFFIFSESNNFQPYEGKVCYKVFDKTNHKTFVIRIFKINIENNDFLGFLKDCTFEYIISKIQKKIGLTVLSIYDLFINFVECLDFSCNYLILIYDDFEFFFQDKSWIV